MAPNPLKTLIKGMFVMLAVAGAVFFVHLVRTSLLEQEQRRIEMQKRYAEENERREREFEQNKAEAAERREREAKERRQAAEAAAKAAAEKNRGIDLTAAFDKKLRQAEAGDPNTQFLVGFIYYVGMNRIVGMRDSRLTVFNKTVVTTLIGEELANKPLVSIPTFTRNDQLAVKWFERAAAQGHQGAQAHLGMANANRGNYPLAYQWMLIAAGPRLPDELSLSTPPIGLRSSMKENFGKRLTPEQLAEAEKMAKEFQPKKETR
jgi:TPR repeat protein